ncbi:transglycosylase SLT domain-containing protein [Providencia rettgeri]
MIIENLKYQIDVDFNGFSNSVRKVKDESTQLSTILSRSNRATTSSFKTAEGSVESFGKKSVASFKNIAIGAASFLGIGLTIEAFRRGLVSTTNAMVDMGTKSSFLGMGVRHLDGFNKGAQALGSNAEQIQNTLMKLQEVQVWKQMPTFAQPAAYSTLEELSTLTGEVITDAKSAEEAMFALSNAIQKLNDNDAMSYKMRLGGLIDDASFLAMRNGTFNSTIKSSINNSSLSEEEVRRAMKLKQVMTELNQSVDNLKNSFFLAFGEEIADGLKSLSKWLIDNKDGIIGFFRELKNIAVSLINTFGDLAMVFAGVQGFSDTEIGAKINSIPTSLVGVMQHPLSKKYYSDELTQSDIDEYNKNYTQQERNYLEKKYIPNNTELLNAIHGSKTSNNSAPSSTDSGTGTVVGNYYKPVFKPKDGEVVLNGNGERYYATTEEYYGSDGKIVNPVKTDAGFQSMDRILDAIAYRESRGDINAKSSLSSAAGAYQLTKGTALDMGLRVDDEVDERFDHAKARAAAERLVKLHLRNNNGNLADAMAAYAGGQGGLNQYVRNGGGLNSESVNSVYEINRYLKGMNLENSKFHNRGKGESSNSTYINTVNVNKPVGSLSQLDSQINLTKTNMGWG